MSGWGGGEAGTPLASLQLSGLKPCMYLSQLSLCDTLSGECPPGLSSANFIYN